MEERLIQFIESVGDNVRTFSREQTNEMYKIHNHYLAHAAQSGCNSCKMRIYAKVKSLYNNLNR